MYNVERMCPSTEPWGTPQFTEYFLPSVPLIETVCCLSSRYKLYQPNTSPLCQIGVPDGGLRWFTMSNAAESSKWSNMITFLWSMANNVVLDSYKGSFCTVPVPVSRLKGFVHSIGTEIGMKLRGHNTFEQLGDEAQIWNGPIFFTPVSKLFFLMNGAMTAFSFTGHVHRMGKGTEQEIWLSQWYVRVCRKDAKPRRVPIPAFRQKIIDSATIPTDIFTWLSEVYITTIFSQACVSFCRPPGLSSSHEITFRQAVVALFSTSSQDPL